jgi:uncharacterized membrane protein
MPGNVLNAKSEPATRTIPKKETLRLNAISDGLFATVLTLLVLDLHIPDGVLSAGGGIAAFIRWIGPHLFSYALTFLVTGTYWSAHHREFKRILDHDRSLIGYNLLFLFFIGLLPFTTASISLTSSTVGEFSFTWAIYAADMILAGIMLDLTWQYAFRHGLVDPSVTPRRNRHVTLRHYVTPLVFLLSIGVEYLFAPLIAGPYALLLIPLLIWVVDRSSGGEEPTPRRAGWSEWLWRVGSFLPWLLVFALAVWATLS